MLLALVLALALAGCATLPEKLPKGPEGRALAPQPSGALARLENQLRPRLGAEGTEKSAPTSAEKSGWQLLDSNEDALRWRLALVDSAEHAIDLQYYFWWEDATGQLLMKHVIDAADRGVKVRILLDDLTTMLEDDRTPRVRDWQNAILNAHPNIELRLFNAFRARTLLGRGVDFLRRMDLMNQRMHNKMLVADNRAVILGGRNIGNEYFGFATEFNFHDLDVLGIGTWPARPRSCSIGSGTATGSFRLARSSCPPHDEICAPRSRAFCNRSRDRPCSSDFRWHAVTGAALLDEVVKSGHVGPSQVLTDVPVPGEVRHRMPRAMQNLMRSAKRELLITNSYVIPDDEDVALFRELRARGVTIKILTNSLASQDVPAVNSHYKRWRKPLVNAGVELYEARPDAAIGPLLADTPPVRSKFVGLHVKAIVVDRERSFIGSMNLDPRSEELNSEMGVVVESVPSRANSPVSWSATCSRRMPGT